jgi:hypothetical protein
MADELAKGFAAILLRVSREAIRSPRELIGREKVIGQILGSIYKRVPVIVVTGPKGIGKTSVLRVIESYLSDDKELGILHTKLGKIEAVKSTVPASFNDFRRMTPYPFYVSINRISEKFLVQELMKSLLTKAEVDSRLKGIITEIAGAAKGIKKVKIGLEGIELERELEKELTRVAHNEPLEILKTVCLKTRDKFPAGMLLILDDADRLIGSNRSIRKFREELFRFIEDNRGPVQLIVCAYLDGSLLQPLKYSDEHAIGGLQESEAVQLIQRSLGEVKKDVAVTIAKRVDYVPLYVVAVCLAIQDSSEFDEDRISQYIARAYESVVEELEPDLADLLRFLCRSDKPLTAAEIESNYGKGRTSVYPSLRLLTFFRLVEKSAQKPARFSATRELKDALE